jgi:hypothetical protein
LSEFHWEEYGLNQKKYKSNIKRYLPFYFILIYICIYNYIKPFIFEDDSAFFQ